MLLPIKAYLVLPLPVSDNAVAKIHNTIDIKIKSTNIKNSFIIKQLRHYSLSS